MMEFDAEGSGKTGIERVDSKNEIAIPNCEHVGILTKASGYSTRVDRGRSPLGYDASLSISLFVQYHNEPL